MSAEARRKDESLCDMLTIKMDHSFQSTHLSIEVEMEVPGPWWVDAVVGRTEWQLASCPCQYPRT